MSDAMAEAKELFLRYDGLRYHLWHDGEAARYDAFGVPAEVERSWRQEVVARRLADLRAHRDTWAVVSLADHGELGYLADVTAALPDDPDAWGLYLVKALEYWDRCAGWRPRGGPVEVSRYGLEELGAALRWIGAGVQRVLERDGADVPAPHRHLARYVAERRDRLGAQAGPPPVAGA